MLSKNHHHITLKKKTLLSNPTLKPLYKLRNSRSTMNIKLPRMKHAKEIKNTITTFTSFNSTTGFSSSKNKYLNNSKLKLFNDNLNFRCLEDFLGKTKDPLEKQKKLYENLKEEKLKIKNVLSNLISWDNEPTAEEIESFKMLNIDGEKEQ
jgi:hypothetical protein